MSSPTPDSDRPEPVPPGSPAPGPGTPPSAEGPPVVSPRRILMVSLPLVAIVGFLGGMAYNRVSHVPKPDLIPWLISDAKMKLSTRLDPKFVDADKDLVADPPTDASALVDPDPLVFSYIAAEDPLRSEETWKPVMDHLAKATGKKVVYFPEARDARDQIKALQEGRLHVTGFNTGSVPAAVNTAGFVPVCVMASPDGSFAYHMELIVPADSPIKSLGDLEGRELTFTDVGSNSGFKAPLVLLHKESHLEPGYDYDVRTSGGHDASIAGIAEKRYQAATVASDVLARAVGRGLIKKDQYRTVYKSQDFPPACLGYVYNLDPALAAKVREALLSFPFEGTAMEKAFKPANRLKFVPIRYKDQWSYVREIDEAIGQMKGPH
jgi:phosphonate transport system substrate-binding protein